MFIVSTDIIMIIIVIIIKSSNSSSGWSSKREMSLSGVFKLMYLTEKQNAIENGLRLCSMTDHVTTEGREWPSHLIIHSVRKRSLQEVGEVGEIPLFNIFVKITS